MTPHPHRPLPRWIRLVCLLAFAPLLATCGVNPVTGKQELNFVSEREEVDIGQKNYAPAQQSQGGEYNVDEELTRYVNGIGQRLAKVSDRPQLPYEFVVLNNGVPNAWALPGGKIAVNRGLLLELNNEAELAAVIGHEIVHAAARHGAKTIERGMLLNVGLIGVSIAASDEKYSNLIVGGASVGTALIITKYGRDAELESDHYGMTYMVRAGYNPQAAVTLQETFVRLSQGKNPNWLEGLFASHPPSPERVEANRKTAQALGNSGRLGAEEYQARIAHLKKTKPAYDAYEKGQQALKEKKSDEALKLANQAIEIEPREALFYSLQGEAWKAKGDQDKAEQSFSRAIEYNPKYFLPHLQRGLTRAKQGNNAAAEQDLSTSARLLPTAPAYLGLGTLAQAAGNEQQAIAYYREAGSSQTASGRQAAIRLARLDLARHPDTYLKTRASLSNTGSVIVHIMNQAAVAVKKVGFSANFVNAGGATVAKRSFGADAVIGVGQTHSVDTGMMPPPNTTLRVLITTAAVSD